MMKNPIWGAFLLLLLMAACTKNTPVVHERHYHFSIDPSTIDQEQFKFHEADAVAFPSVSIFKSESFNVEVKTPSGEVDRLVEIHLQVLPVYVFGTGNAAGDYYAVTGYVISHNADAFKAPFQIYTEKNSDVKMMGWYMSNLGLELQLLSDAGKAVNNQDVNFFIQPEPSTTIGQTVYTKGFSFTLAPNLTIGGVKSSDPGAEPSWGTTLLGVVSLGFKWDNQATQVLPDQSVEMWTDPDNRSVCYNFKTNNVRNEMSPDAIPVFFRTDQRVDFSWVWYVRSGAYAAKDNGFGNMRMRVTVNPEYKSFVEGLVFMDKVVKDDEGKEKTVYDSKNISLTGISAPVSKLTHEFDLPPLNRIPTGNFTLKNCTRNYLTRLTAYRQGEYGVSEAYAHVEGVCDTNESVSSILREGTYDLYYELVNGDTGESYGLFVIRNVKINPSGETVLTTFDAQRVS